MTLGKAALMNEVPEFRFRFSLRAMIIGLTVTGCVIGLLGKLMLSNFQIFAAVVSIAAVIVPFVLAIATLVRIGKRTKNRGLTIWAAILFLAPIVGIGSVGLLQVVSDPSNTGKGAVSNRRLIEGQLAKSPDDWQVWRELEHRVVTGKLNKEEGGQVAAVLSKYMKSKRPTGAWGKPLNHAEDFFGAARQRDLIPEPQLLKLCDAYFGTEPKLKPINAKSNVKRVEIEFGSRWDNEMHHGLGVRHVWDVTRILVDGQPVELEPTSSHSGNRMFCRLKDALPLDGKELMAEVEVAYIDSSKLIGLHGDIPVARWPKAIKRWQQTVTIPLDGSDPTKRKPKPIQLVTDPALAPSPLQIERLVVQPDEGGLSTIVVKWKSLHETFQSNAAVSYDVFVDTGDEEVHVGSTFVVRKGTGTTSNGSQLVSRGHLIAADIEAADVILRPSPKYLEGVLENSPDMEPITEIWGKSSTIEDVTLERLDLEASRE